jgi:hypothetical protein
VNNLVAPTVLILLALVCVPFASSEEEVFTHKIKLREHSTGKIVEFDIGESPGRKYFEKERNLGFKRIKELSRSAKSDSTDSLSPVEDFREKESLDFRIYSADEFEISEDSTRKRISCEALKNIALKCTNKDLAIAHISKSFRDKPEISIKNVLPLIDSLQFKRVCVHQDSSFFTPQLLDVIYEFKQGSYCCPGASVWLSEKLAETIGKADAYMQIDKPENVTMENCAKPLVKKLLVVALTKTGPEGKKLWHHVEPNVEALGFERVLVIAPHVTGCLVLSDQTRVKSN